MEIKIPEEYKDAVETITSITKDAYLVGGYIRDFLVGIENNDADIDIAVNGKYIDSIKDAFEKKKYTINTDGLKFGVITVYLKNGSNVDIAEFRNESYDSSSRKPKVKPSDNIYDDIKRRDFTITAMAYNLSTKELIDNFNGREDIKKKIIKAVGNPDERFDEDPLRILRGIRLATKLGFNIEDRTLKSMGKNAYKLEKVSGERIRDELIKGLEANSKRFFELLEKSGVLYTLIEELEGAKELKHDNRHGHYGENLIEHIIDVLE
jgi:tRNA nucleotidyltransferase (CCA-adding enzyme)